jgi:hypothetical protein
MHRLVISLVAGLALQAGASPAHAYTLWYNTTNAQVTGQNSGVNRGPDGVTVFTGSSFGGYVLDLGLDVPSNVSVTGVELCYYMSTAYIYTVDVFENATPLATLLHEDTQLNSETRTCTLFPMTPTTPGAPFAVRVAVVTTGPTSMTLAAVGLEVQPTTTSVIAPGPLGTSRLAGSFPNPASLQATIEFETSTADPTRLQILDVAGRLIRTIEAGTLAVGRHRVTWDTRDESGRGVSAGVYFYRIVTTRGTSALRQLTVIR